RIGSSIVVDDQDQAEQSYTKVLGVQVKTSAPYGPKERWLSMVAPEEPDGVQLVHLADEAARAGGPVPAVVAGVAEGSPSVFRREGEYWTVVFDGSVVRLRD